MEKYTVQDYYNYMKFNPDDEDVPQEFLDEYISDVTDTDWFITHAEMINDFLDSMRMGKLSDAIIAQDSEVDKMASLLKIAKVENMAFDTDARIRAWIDISDLEYENKIEEIKNMTVTLEEKIRLAKEFARDLALGKVYNGDVEIEEPNLLSETHDSIDWVSLFEVTE